MINISDEERKLIESGVEFLYSKEIDEKIVNQKIAKLFLNEIINYSRKYKFDYRRVNPIIFNILIRMEVAGITNRSITRKYIERLFSNNDNL